MDKWIAIAYSVDLQTSWTDFSPALHWDTSRTVRATLRRFSARIRSVKVRITSDRIDDLNTRRCTMEVAMKPYGLVSASVTGVDLQEIVELGAIRLRAEIQQRLSGESTIGDERSRIA